MEGSSTMTSESKTKPNLRRSLVRRLVQRARSAAMPLALAGVLLVGAGCNGQSGRVAYPTTASSLALSNVVLYRNGVGYFERQGEVDGNILRIRVRKDQVSDLLKSLTIVDRRSGQAVSVSMPLDPQTWANRALATLAPGRGSLYEILDSLRGVEVTLDTIQGTVSGRVAMVEHIYEEPDPTMPRARGPGGSPAYGNDYKVTLMEEDEMRVVRLSKVKGLTLRDGDLALQFHRHLDAAAGEGMFQQVEVAIRLNTDDVHDLVVSYVVEAPMWKPTYRVVLPEDGKGEALLQAWAVVDNVSGEDWRDVRLALTAGAPIAFKYDLHRPRHVPRQDLSHAGNSRSARVALGETTFDESPPPPPEPMPDDDAGYGYDYGDASGYGALAKAEARALGGYAPPGSMPAPAPKPARAYGPRGSANKDAKKKRDYAANYRTEYDRYDMDEAEEAEPSISFDSLHQSTMAQAKARAASGLTRFDIDADVTVPDGSSTMVAIVNQAVQGEETFLFKPGGAGVGYESNPYRVIRFRNTTPFVLEPGPISIYSGGSFVGEGISEVVGAGTSATIPFAVESGIIVERDNRPSPEEKKLVKIVKGVLEAERFHQITTKWSVKAQTIKDGFKVLIRHPKAGPDYKLKDRPEGTEDLPGAFLIPISVPAGELRGNIEIVEQTPAKVSVNILSREAIGLLEDFVALPNLTPDERAKLKPIIDMRRAMGTIETQIDAKQKQQRTANERASFHNDVADKLKDDKTAEGQKQRQASLKALEEFSEESDKLAREILALQSEWQRKKFKLQEMLVELTIIPKN